MRMLRVLVLHGPNLNLLGEREQAIYGATTLPAINEALLQLGHTLGVKLDCRQSNHEGELVSWIQQAKGEYDGIIINPAAYTHTSVAIRDALAAVAIPAVEVHLTNIYQREAFRHHSYIAGVVMGHVTGFGPLGYLLALRGLYAHLSAKDEGIEEVAVALRTQPNVGSSLGEEAQ
ncbi:MAG: type II 3-dehydroquinate dehydratase [Nitrospira sp.]|nr:type II 3-dehydroquinate dehydratase [Nitrospira sp.]